jgi:hypothetical protein
MAQVSTADEEPRLYWRIMQALDASYGWFDSKTITAVVGNRHRKGIERYLAFLADERVLDCRVFERGARVSHRYGVQRKGEAPPLRRAADATLGRRQQALWTTMRILRSFTAQDLAISASVDTLIVPRGTAASYISDLAAAGYVVQAGGGKTVPAPVYRLLPGCNTGPRAPVVLRGRGLFDLNLMREITPSDGRTS